MTTLSDRLVEYLDHRRRFGYRHISTTAAVLRRFAAFAEDFGAESITTELFLEWRKQFEAPSDVTWGCNLSHVRGFAKWLHCLDPRTEVPSADLIRRGSRRPRPYIYTEEELARIVEHAAQLPSPRGLNAWTFSTLFGLIAVTGLRLGEALGLDEADVNLDEGILTITRRSATSTSTPSTSRAAPGLRPRLNARRTTPRPARLFLTSSDCILPLGKPPARFYPRLRAAERCALCFHRHVRTSPLSVFRPSSSVGAPPPGWMSPSLRARFSPRSISASSAATAPLRGSSGVRTADAAALIPTATARRRRRRRASAGNGAPVCQRASPWVPCGLPPAIPTGSRIAHRPMSSSTAPAACPAAFVRTEPAPAGAGAGAGRVSPA